MRIWWGALAALVAAAACAGSAGAVTVTVGHSTLAIPCGAPVQADWYKPAGTPTGLVWLQHGYGGSKSDMAELAGVIAARTGALVVAPSVGSINWGDGCWILGAPLEQAVARVVADRSALAASARAAGFTGTLPTDVVLAGHSAGGNLALTAAGYLNGVGVRGVVMFDGGAGDDATQAQQALVALPADFPTLDIAAPIGGPCHTHNLYPDALVAARPGQFVGVQIVGGKHLDALGYSAWVGMLYCGWSDSQNVTAVQQIGTDWIRNALTGSSGGITDGAPGQRIPVGAATAVVLGQP